MDTVIEILKGGIGVAIMTGAAAVFISMFFRGGG